MKRLFKSVFTIGVTLLGVMIAPLINAEEPIKIREMTTAQVYRSDSGGILNYRIYLPSDSMRMTIELLDKVRATYSVDNSRIYVTGLSMGGYGTWDMIQRNPKTFAGALVVCGGGDTKQAPNLVKMPLLVTHGELDRVVKTRRSRDMVAAIKKAGGKNIRYIEYKGVHHNVWKPVYSDEKNLKWLLGQKKVQYTVVEDIDK